MFLKTLTGWLLGLAFLAAVLAIGGLLGPVVLPGLAGLIAVVALVSPGGEAAKRGRLFALHAIATMFFVLAGILAPFRAAVAAAQLHWSVFPANFFLEYFGL